MATLAARSLEVLAAAATGKAVENARLPLCVSEGWAGRWALATDQQAFDFGSVALTALRVPGRGLPLWLPDAAKLRGELGSSALTIAASARASPSSSSKMTSLALWRSRQTWPKSRLEQATAVSTRAA